MLGWYSWAQFLRQNYDWSVVAIWIGAVCGFLALVAEPPSWRLQISRAEGAVLGLVMVVGAALRLYRVDAVPFGLNHDAAYSGLVALKAIHSSTYIPWSPTPLKGNVLRLLDRRAHRPYRSRAAGDQGRSCGRGRRDLARYVPIHAATARRESRCHRHFPLAVSGGTSSSHGSAGA
jgi:hypothetical protein